MTKKQTSEDKAETPTPLALPRSTPSVQPPLGSSGPSVKPPLTSSTPSVKPSLASSSPSVKPPLALANSEEAHLAIADVATPSEEAPLAGVATPDDKAPEATTSSKWTLALAEATASTKKTSMALEGSTTTSTKKRSLRKKNSGSRKALKRSKASQDLTSTLMEGDDDGESDDDAHNLQPSQVALMHGFSEFTPWAYTYR